MELHQFDYSSIKIQASTESKEDGTWYRGDYSFNTGKVRLFTMTDYIVFAAALFISAGIGFYNFWIERHKATLNNYLLADRQMGAFPVGLSLLGSFMSAITLLGLPAEMYCHTTMYWWLGGGYFLTMAGAAHIYVPVFYNLRITSAFEYLERRFGCTVRTVASIGYIIQMTFYLAIVLFAPSLALNAVTGFTLWGSVVSVGLIASIYTALGGMKAVMWTDTFQMTTILISLVFMLIRSSHVVGGWDVMWDSAVRTERVLLTDFRADPTVRHTVWSLVIGGYFTWVVCYGVNQAQVQRSCCCPSLRTAQVALWLNVPGLWIILYLTCLIGLFMATFYEHCDPLKAKLVNDANQLLPLFVMDALVDTAGLPGLFVVSLFSGALSTLSSGLNAISAVVMQDVIKPFCLYDMSDQRATHITMGTTFLFGIICLGLTTLAARLGDILQGALALYGMIGGPLLGVFSLGMFNPYANSWGGIAGLISSFALLCWIGIGAQINKAPQQKALMFIDHCNRTAFNNVSLAALAEVQTSPAESDRSVIFPLYTISYMWYSFIAVFTCLIVGTIVSFATGASNPKEVDPRLICPLFDHMFPFCCLPDNIRKPLRFGVEHEGKYERESFYPLPVLQGESEDKFSKEEPWTVQPIDDKKMSLNKRHGSQESMQERILNIDYEAFKYKTVVADLETQI